MGRIIPLQSRQWRSYWNAVAALVLVLGTIDPIGALNINLVFNSAANQAPTFDPTSSGLQSLFDYAETFYQDVFEDTHTITINYWYEDLTGSTLGVHNLVSQSGVPNRETEANIRIDTRSGTGGAFRDWYIDGTPASNSEFDMQQVLWRDLTVSQRSDFYNDFGASIPATFETGFVGAAVAGGAAVGATDMLSVVLHEVGHALGMSSLNTATIAQTADNDYDFNSAFVFGQTLAAEVADGANIAHLDNENSLMFPSVSSGLRRLPSHTDLFSMASGHAYSALDVPRREFYGGNNWNTSGNWSGDTVPGSSDEVFVRNPGAVVTASLSGTGFASVLHISEGSNVNTQGFKLTVGNTVNVSDLNSDIFVSTGGELEAGIINIRNDAELNINGGLVDANSIVLTQGTTLTFLQGIGGTIDVQTTLNNNATIRATGGGTLTFTSSGGGVWDLDGTSGNGIVQAILGNLTFASGSVADTFGGDIDVGNGTDARTLSIAQPWSLGIGGIIDMTGGATAAERAAITGGAFTASSGLIRANAGINQIQSPTTLGASVSVTVEDSATLEFTGTTSVGGGTYNANSSGQIEFAGTTSYTGGTLSVSGVVQQNGDAAVTGDTTISGERFDLDGDTGASVDWSIGNAALVLNVDSIESAGNGGNFNGTITVNSSLIVAPASLTVNINGGSSWTMAGTLNTNGTADPFIAPTIGAGTPILLAGTANVDGNNSWAARVDISGTINTVDATSTIRLTGGSIADPNRLLGGSIVGPGTLSASTNDALHGNGSIATAINFLGDAELRADNGTLTISGVINDVGTIGTADSDGVLLVSNPWNTAVANQLELRGGTVTGAAISNSGTTVGFGMITSTSFTNNNTTSASGGTLSIDPVIFPDLDGAPNTGTINAVAGDILVPGNLGGAYVLNGTVNVGTNRNFQMPATGLVNSGAINLTAGRMALASFRQNNLLLVNPGLSTITDLAGGIEFASAGTTTLNGDLLLEGSSLIQAGATFAGPRRLMVASGGALRLANGANVGVGVLNNGRTEVGASPGIALVASYAQSAGGTYEAEIDGLLIGTQYDQLQVTDAALLAGSLDIQVNQNGGSYADPVSAGSFHAFTLITAGSVAGDFDSVTYDGSLLVPEFGIGPGGDFVALASCGLFRVVDYSNNDLQLINYRALPGDANGDGFVDGSDFNTWNSNKFTNNTDWASGDFNCDGVTDGGDFNIWNSNKFTSIALPMLAGGNAAADIMALNVVPEPNAMALGAGALLILGLTRIRPAPARRRRAVM